MCSVNNAGFTWDGVIQKMTPDQWQTMLDVHCTAPFRLVQAATPHMRDAAKKVGTLCVLKPLCAPAQLSCSLPNIRCHGFCLAQCI